MLQQTKESGNYQLYSYRPNIAGQLSAETVRQPAGVSIQGVSIQGASPPPLSQHTLLLRALHSALL